MLTEEEYKELINPAKIAKDMSMEDFERWTLIGRNHPMYLQSLKDALIAFEKEEMYLHCAILKKRIDEERMNPEKRSPPRKTDWNETIEQIFPYLPSAALFLVYLKVTKKIDWDWVFVLSPIWTPGIALTVFYSIIYGKIKRKK